MKHLLNTLFVTSKDVYLTLDGENVVVNREKREIARYPLHNLLNIISFLCRSTRLSWAPARKETSALPLYTIGEIPGASNR